MRKNRLAPPAPDKEFQQIMLDLNEADAAVRRLRPQLHARMYEYREAYGDRRGWQTELVKMTGLTRERIRQIIEAEELRRDAAQEADTAA
jgi:hypothetical protein